MALFVNDARVAWKALTGVVNLYKPAGLHPQKVLEVLVNRITQGKVANFTHYLLPLILSYMAFQIWQTWMFDPLESRWQLRARQMRK